MIAGHREYLWDLERKRVRKYANAHVNYLLIAGLIFKHKPKFTELEEITNIMANG